MASFAARGGRSCPVDLADLRAYCYTAAGIVEMPNELLLLGPQQPASAVDQHADASASGGGCSQNILKDADADERRDVDSRSADRAIFASPRRTRCRIALLCSAEAAGAERGLRRHCPSCWRARPEAAAPRPGLAPAMAALIARVQRAIAMGRLGEFVLQGRAASP
jgi:hypothetical protein